MTSELLEIQPTELKFIFELKKQSSCLIQLGNKSNEHVAFKVKTTSPKKYCVRPNTGVLKPNATCDFTVTMQAQRVAPLDLQCKDKFLIQSTVVPSGTTEDEITSAMFVKDSEKYIEEKKLRVLLVSPPDSPVLQPRNGESNQEQWHENSMQKDSKVNSGLENVPSPLMAFKDVDELEQFTKKNDDESREKDGGNGHDSTPTTKDWNELCRKTEEDFNDTKPSNDESTVLQLSKDFKDLTFKLSFVESKLKEAELTIMKLTEEKKNNTKDREMLKHELEMLKRKNNVRNVQFGFPLLYVFMVALIGLAIGYFLHP